MAGIDRRFARNGGILVLAAVGVLGIINKWEDGGKKVPDAGYVVYADKLAGGLPTTCNGITKHVATVPVVVGERWSKEKCDQQMAQAVERVQRGLANCLTYPGLTQNQLDSLSSFAWNVGVFQACSSSAVRLMNQGNVEAGCRAISQTPDGRPNWSMSGGRYVQGLYNRRLDETALCLKPSGPATR